MGRLTHHNTPGPVGRPRHNSVGHAIIASVGEWGRQGHETCSSLVCMPSWVERVRSLGSPIPRDALSCAYGEDV
eukprot:2519636-Prymnesium_polylepis.2